MIDSNRLRRQRGGVLGWLAFVFLVISACLVMGGLFFAHNVKVRESHSGNRNDVQVDTPIGSVHVQHGDTGNTRAIGIPIYPGAKQVKDGESASVDLSAVFGDKNLQIIAGKWETSDPIDKVQKYYEDKFPDMNVVQHHGKVEMHSVNGHAKRVIALREHGGATEIALASVGEPKAN